MTDYDPNALTGAVLALTFAVILIGTPRELWGRRFLVSLAIGFFVLGAVSL